MITCVGVLQKRDGAWERVWMRGVSARAPADRDTFVRARVNVHDVDDRAPAAQGVTVERVHERLRHGLEQILRLLRKRDGAERKS